MPCVGAGAHPPQSPRPHQCFLGFYLLTLQGRKEKKMAIFTSSLCPLNNFVMSGAPNSVFRCSTHGYVVMWHRGSRTLQSLFNPLTNHEVSLLPTNLSWINVVNVLGDSIKIYRGSDSEISCWQLGDANWNSRHVKVHEPVPKLIYCNGFVFHVDPMKRTTGVFDAAAGSFVVEIPCPIRETDHKESCFHDYLIESSGELLGVWRLISVWIKQSSFVVYKFRHSGNDKFNWVKINDIGDRILLLDKLGATDLSVSGKDHGFKGNCIYFHDFQNVNGQRFTVFSRYDIKDGSIEELARLLEPHGFSWSRFVPSVQ